MKTVINPLFAIDFYKADHRRQYPKGTTKVYSNFTPRSARLHKGSMDKIVAFGLQMFIKDFLIDNWNEGFFARPKAEVVEEYEAFMDATLGAGAIPVEHIAELHALGYLPLEIKALPEGSLVPMKVPVLTIENTHDDFSWLVNYVETVMSTELWKPMTNATIAYEYRSIFERFATITGAPKEGIVFQGHDFSARGLSNREDGFKAGIAHLTSFVGTDTVLAIQGAKTFYNADWRTSLVGTSVPATEHSVMCLGEKDSEVDTFKRLITDLYPTGIVSIVSDTWDFWKVISEYTIELKKEILGRKENALGLAKVVFRPDSGNPADILCGTNNYQEIIPGGDDWFFAISEAVDDRKNIVVRCEGVFYEVQGDYIQELIEDYGSENVPFNFGELSSGSLGYAIKSVEVDTESNEAKGAVEILWDIFGGTVNEKGYKELHPRVGLIYGDSITLERQQEILSRLEAKGFASSNVVFGIGSYSYQYNTRDTFGMAMKATYGVVNGEAREIFKDPITDDGIKKSARGLLRVDLVEGEYVLTDQCTREQANGGELKLVFKDGKLLNETSLEEIRDRLW